jgi:NAD(P)-dependent dehydrogenase (short-subunit alcohol dehydrogenase family)
MERSSRVKTARTIARGFDLTGRTVMITGASSGLGAETARAMALTGADLILTGRNVDALKLVAHDAALGSGASCHVLQVDQSDLASVERLARDVSQLAPSIDVLICNAGVAQTPADRLCNGLDVRCVTNHLSHFLLADRLMDLLVAGRARVIVLGSAGHKGRPVRIDDLGWLTRAVDQRIAYGESKSAISLFAVEATRRWQALGVYVNTVQPGSVVTGLQRHHSPQRLREMTALAKFGDAGSVFVPVGQAAATTVWAALAAELEGRGGLILENCGLARLATPRTHVWTGYESHAIDAQLACALWTVTASLLQNLGYPTGTDRLGAMAGNGEPPAAR